MRPLFVLPGIGADERLFDGQRAVRDIRVIPWIPPSDSSETLAHYAARLAATLHIDEPFDLGGASFGGMVALELARHLSPERVFLFGSGRSPDAVAPWLRALRRLAPILPARPPRMAAQWFGAKTPAHVQLFVDMLAATPPPFIRWAANAIFTWPGAEELSIPVRHIHGDRDHIIPLRRVAPERVITGAGHLLNLTHADAVNDFIV